MALAALLLSGVACLIAIASATFTYQQAHAQREATGIERDRRHEETAPAFSAECEDVNGDGAFYRLWVTLESDLALDSLSVQLPTGAALRFVAGIEGVAAGSDGRQAHSYDGPITPGDRACWRVEMLDDEDSAELQTAVVTSSRSGSNWDRRVTFDLPYDIGPTLG